MPRHKKPYIEFRDYNLPARFPVLLLSGEEWRISDIPSPRLHIHNCLEIGLCRSDCGTMVFEDTKRPFKAGDVTVISCDVPHTTYSAPGTASRWSYLFVDLTGLLTPLSSGSDLRIFNLLNTLEHRICLILDEQEYPGIHALTAEIMRELEQREEYYEVSVRGLFLALLADLVRAVLQIAGPNEKKDDQPPENALVIAPALEYIRCHYMEDFSMEYLAGLCSLSPAHFRRLFSAVIETSPLKYLNVTRIRQAAVLLRTTEASVLSISEEVGYRSVSSFNRQFRDTMGQTPHEWRRRMSILKDQSVMKYRGFLVPETLTPDEPESGFTGTHPPC